ncbi:hypothetical protein D3C85_1003510 [compost metagenome]
MPKKAIRELLGRPLRGPMFQEFSDMLAEYNVQIMDLDDKFYGFIHTNKTNQWYRMGLVELTADERKNPDVEALEAEFGYSGCDIDDEEEGDEA